MSFSTNPNRKIHNGLIPMAANNIKVTQTLSGPLIFLRYTFYQCTTKLPADDSTIYCIIGSHGSMYYLALGK